MALVNVAVQLAIGGKKVLIVDFDLEAPGIPTFSLTAPKTEVRGIVEYIGDYLASGVAPDVRQYVYSAETFPGGGELIVMPAGLHDGTYSGRLNSIDWNHLYKEKDGYLFFEDLKRQWNRSVSPDYVLIDSRTGHSDVEGICTRQLPDALCLLFFPNEQNLQGLKRVVGNVRSQNQAGLVRKNEIALHFAVSNVPDLDDEDGIVGSTLERFRSELEYNELSGVIHHYNSLSLLNQEIFSEKRPKSRLAREYKALAECIIRDNLGDRDVATKFLRQTVRDLRSASALARTHSVVEKVERVLRFFQSDTQIVADVSLIYEAIGRTEDALVLLAGGDGQKSANDFAIRARLQHRAGNKSEAVADLTRMLDCPGAELPSLLEALSIASQLEPALFQELANSVAIKTLSNTDKEFVADQIDGGLHELAAKAALYEQLLIETTSSDAASIEQRLALASIGLCNYRRALDLLTKPGQPARETDISNAFNIAMAEWGAELTPNMHSFGIVVDLHAKSRTREATPNYFACIAIASAVTGDVESATELIGKARALMKTRPRREFSPWTYSNVQPRDFLSHLTVLEQQIANQSIVPEFVKRARAAYA